MLEAMHDMNAEDAWQSLNITALEECSEPLGEPSSHWQQIALALSHRRDALDCMAAVEALATCDSDTRLAGRTLGGWSLLGKAYIDSSLLSLGLEPKYGFPGDRTYPQFFSSQVANCVSLYRTGAPGYEEFSSALLASNDPLLWYEGAPLLARLAIMQGDGSVLRELHSIATENFREAPWYSFLEEQVALYEQTDIGRCVEVRTFFAEEAKAEADAVLRMLGGELGSELTSLAGIQARIDSKHERSAILTLDKAQLCEFLAAGATVVVHEERPVHPGFSKLCAFDESSEIVLVDSMLTPGRELRRWQEQESRMHLYGASALVVLGEKAIALVHDEGLATLGVTETTQHDPELGRARQEQLARLAVESCKDIPRAWQLHGLALFAQLAAEELEGKNADGPMEQWYGHARTRFAEAEWAHQIYAQALEEWGLFEEAAIAWNDAYRLDSFDARNLLGIARTRAREGLVNAAIPYARRALCADPGALDAWRLRAELAASVEDTAAASQAASIVLLAKPDDPTGHRIIGSQAERDDSLQQALEHFDSAAEGGNTSHLARASMLAARLGDFEGAQARALAVLERDPENYANHLRASECFVRTGSVDDAVGVLEYALSRFGPHEALVIGYSERIIDLLSEEDCTARVRAFLESWGEYEQPLTNLGQSLSTAGRLALAIECFERAHRAGPDSLNPIWQQVQSYVRNDSRDAANELLKDMLEKTPLPHAHALWTELNGAATPDACWESLGKADAESDPVLVWASARFLADERGDEEAVAGLTERLLGVPIRAIGSALGYLVQTKALSLAGHLIPMLEQHSNAKDGLENTLHSRSLYAYHTGDLQMAATLLDEMHSEFPSSTVTWQELTMVLEAGNADVLRRLSDKALRALRRGSPESFGDGMTEQANLAAAEMLAGEFGPMEDLLEAHPLCIPALECAAKAAYANHRERADAWMEKLAALAPGRFLQLDRWTTAAKGANS
tara:strand:+ start:22085 stop:24997 length:2913 start_codon:yes stop_codon:yes gene_type:complete